MKHARADKHTYRLWRLPFPDCVMMVLDASKADVQKRLLTKELETVGIRLNQKPADIIIKR